MSRVVIPSKFIGDILYIPLDFTSRLVLGETITSRGLSVSTYSGVDANPSALLLGSSLSGNIVTAQITGGLIGVIYEVFCNVGTSLGQTVSQASYLAVVPHLP